MSIALSREILARVKELEKFLGYTFKDSTLAWEAMRRTGGGGEMNGRTQKENNKRLAILGDIVIYLVMGREWYPSNKTTELFSNMRAKQTTNKFFSAMAMNLNLHTRFVFPQQADLGVKAMATWVEAVVGAVWLDSGEDSLAVREVLLKLGILKKEQITLKAPAKSKKTKSKVVEAPKAPKAPMTISKPWTISQPVTMISITPSPSETTKRKPPSRLPRPIKSTKKTVQTAQPISCAQARYQEQLQQVRGAALDEMMDDLEERVKKLRLMVKEREQLVGGWRRRK